MWRWCFRIIHGVLYIPMFGNVMRPIDCDDGTWLATDWTCYGSAHLAVFIPSIALLIFGVVVDSMCRWIALLAMLLRDVISRRTLVSFAVALCCFDGDANSDSYAAKPHGRTEAIVQTTRLGLLFMFTLEHQVGKAALIVTLVLSALITVYCYLRYLPFYNQRTNRAFTAAAFVYAWAVVCTVMLELRGKPEVRIRACRAGAQP